MKREQARAAKREKRLAETNMIIQNSELARAKENTTTTAPSTAASTWAAPTEGETKSGVVFTINFRGSFDTKEIIAMEENEDEENEDSGSNSDSDEEEVDEELMARGSVLFDSIDSDGNGEIKKNEFVIALDSGNLEMTDEIKT